MTLESMNEKLNTFHTSPSQSTFEVEIHRQEVNYEDLSLKFICPKKDFKKQFAHIYSGRLMLLKERVSRFCSLKWGEDIPVRKLSELTGENYEKCIVIGTLFKHQELKPSILKELFEENQVMPQPPRSNFISDEDQLILEDEIQRIRLVGLFDIKKYVTGVVVGLLGSKNEEGKFEVADMCFAEPEVLLHKPLIVENDCYVLLISGLKVGSPEALMALEVLLDFIKGDLGSVSDQEKWANVCRIVIAGNSIATLHTNSKIGSFSSENEEGFSTLEAVKLFDNIFEDLVRSVEVDLMPGEFDPSNYLLPQQAMYNCVFPKASQYKTFHCVTNPYECKLDGRRILGTSGQPVNNIKSFTDFEKPLDILEKTLLWGHLAPTAPDTLACYPYYEQDPFIITEQPDIYFAGNQPDFETKMVSQNGAQCRIICIPSFYTTQMCILVNLKNLDCTPIIIKV